MIDSHCHLAGEEFDHDLADVVERAVAAGVSGALVIVGADDEKEYERAQEVTRRWSGVRLSIGVHPHAAGGFVDEPGRAARLVEERLQGRDAARAIGEIGLDYHYAFSPRDVQQAVFREQIGLARRMRLPIVIHTREAEEDTFRILAEESSGEIRGVFHCFTGDRAMARRALDAGFHISLAGIVTFPRAVELHGVAKVVPLDRLLIETDSPFLAPVPHRGTRNEPARVVCVAEAIARLRATTVEVVGQAARENFDRLFNP
ncbi:MAG: TatD family hydrolase [Acidobacteria bacterium]|nr:TatD family hydrolase [Acidobacteriota bacterium]